MKIDNTIKIGDNIKRIRKSRGIQQKAMAEKLGIQNASYCKYENNYHRPKYEMVERIATILNVDVMQLIYGNESTHFESEVLDMETMSTKQLKDLIAKATDELINRIGR